MGNRIECPYCGSLKTKIFTSFTTIFDGGRRCYDVACESCGRYFSLITRTYGQEVEE